MQHSSPLLMSTLLGVVFGLGITGFAHAERTDHFKGKPAETLEQALENFSEYNHKLEAILSGSDLGPASLAQIHEHTYTLENALGRIQQEIVQLTDALEQVHVASETNDTKTTLEKGREYLSVSQQTFRH